jgi:hypothetical protein
LPFSQLVVDACSGGTYPPGAQLVITRPEGYFSRERDAITIDGAPVEQEPYSLPTQDTFVVDLPKSDAVQITLRKESIAAIPSDDLARELPIVDFPLVEKRKQTFRRRPFGVPRRRGFSG